VAADECRSQPLHASGIAGVKAQQDLVLYDSGYPVCRIAVHWLRDPAEVPVVITSHPRHAGEHD